MQVKAVIFDFDGVIVNSMPLHLVAWQKVIESHFSTRLDDPESLIGLSSKKIASLLADRYGAPDLADRLLIAKQAQLRQSQDKAPLIRGIEALWKTLTNRDLPFAICSNAPRKFIEKQLFLHQLEKPLIVALEDTSTPKPDPTPYLVSCELLKIDAHQKNATVVFEDSCHGIKAGKEAGLFTCGITSQHDSDHLLKAGADLTFKDHYEVLSDQNLLF